MVSRMKKNPTPYPEVNHLLQELFEGVQTILGSHLIGLYLDGSLAGDGFDQDSDIDFVTVTDEEITSETFSALQVMHERLAAMDSIWAIQLEGSYLPRYAIRRYDPAHTLYPNLERGKGERLKLVHHDETWDTHRYVLREHGITLAGPPAHTLIDPVLPTQLRQAMQSLLSRWVAPLLEKPDQIKQRGYQAYTVHSLCRILYTLQYGTVVSKKTAAEWAQATLDRRWVSFIEGAWVGRHDPNSEASPEEINETLEFIRFTLEINRQ
jgi:hypothetical protein